MTMLIKNTLPAERVRGCIFAEQFRNTPDIIENRGKITGALTFDDNGAYFDGNSYISYGNAGYSEYLGLFTPADDVSILVECFNDFTVGDGNSYELFEYKMSTGEFNFTIQSDGTL